MRSPREAAGRAGAAPSLHEVQQAMRRSLVAGDDAIAAWIEADGIAAAERLALYRDNFVGVATRALRLNHPAVLRLVGDAFFDATARAFVTAQPPASAWLDDYGETFADFLQHGPAASSLPYLPDVARLEWAVGRVLHAPAPSTLDAAGLAVLAALPLEDQGRLRLDLHPALRLLRSDFPVDRIWRAVLAGDDAALAAIDLDEGPRWLLVERTSEGGESGIAIERLGEAEWIFTLDLGNGVPLQRALDRVVATDVADGIDPAALIARHVASGRCTGFALDDAAPPPIPTPPSFQETVR